MARNKAKKGSVIAVPEPNQFDTASALIVDNPSSRNDSVEPLNGTNGDSCPTGSVIACGTLHSEAMIGCVECWLVGEGSGGEDQGYLIKFEIDGEQRTRTCSDRQPDCGLIVA
ncbi:hypothetical protein PCH_Pc16g00870 [Penicillium rubens Wisconsin 54-1255]|uniref:Uncharacterized protein n=1 Tax=Penicillium rubens (strain ATCC 28089 / DSM 1075 / NRRL 1951 / Wisconsin 54-1255) TaxID=500485 RepID=B6H6Z3_PENRW|nr:hypothetical protein PCH_Pc16g00870 [Penicillium rubens Wisconsin 54-1255]